MAYQRIKPLPADFTDTEAESVESLREAWVEQKSGLADSGALGEFNERLARRWAIETGIIERLYTLDRGTTEILINKGLDAALIEHGTSDLSPAELVVILKDHRDAASYVIDYVAQHRGLTNHFIRSIHALLTRSQNVVEAEDQFGRLIQTPLRKGEWKQIPNNPRRQDGEIHEYCPPELVNDEMESLVAIYNQIAASGAPAVTRAAWLHHRFTQIHPFQDGNGRVARALTALVFVSDHGFPIVVDRDLRSQYIESLEIADNGDLKPLVRLFAMLQKKEIEEALSLSENALTKEQAAPGGMLRARLLSALRDRAREKRLSITNKRKSVIDTGRSIFDSVIVEMMTELASELNAILSVEMPGSHVRVERGDEEKRHFFKAQIVSIAQTENYFCDLETIHEWARLRVQRPGEGDNIVNEIVVSMHSLGRQFTGVLAISIYFAVRYLDETNRSVVQDPHRLAERSLTFSYLENETNIAKRVREWLNDALNLGIAQIQQSL